MLFFVCWFVNYTLNLAQNLLTLINLFFCFFFKECTCRPTLSKIAYRRSVRNGILIGLRFVIPMKQNMAPERVQKAAPLKMCGHQQYCAGISLESSLHTVRNLYVCIYASANVQIQTFVRYGNKSLPYLQL